MRDRSSDKTKKRKSTSNGRKPPAQKKTNKVQTISSGYGQVKADSLKDSQRIYSANEKENHQGIHIEGVGFGDLPASLPSSQFTTPGILTPVGDLAIPDVDKRVKVKDKVQNTKDDYI